MGPFDVDWSGILRPETAALEIVVRGTLMYFVILFLLRFVLRRIAGELGILDLSQVKAAYFEGDGRISVIPHADKDRAGEARVTG